MDERILKWLYDIKLAIEEIEGFFPEGKMDFLEYSQNIMLKRAVERNLEIIGEAVSRILKRDPLFTNEVKEAKSIVGLRNQVIHAYDNISDENIWAILVTHLPILKKDVNALINNADSSPSSFPVVKCGN